LDNNQNTKNIFESQRQEIDDIDNQLISLLTRRQDLASEVGKIKNEMGISIFNSAREEQVYNRLTSKSQTNLPKEAIRHIFSEIISASRSVQTPVNVAYLGPEATFSHQACIYFFGHSSSFRAAETIEDVYSLVEKGVCQLGLVPIENSYEGSVNLTMDLFYKYDLKICAEIYLRIRHHLMSKSNKMDEIKKVYSHPMAIAQCRSWLKSNLGGGVPIYKVESTSLAAKMASEEPVAAAVGSRLAALTYTLNMLAENIEDQPDNITRFLVIGRVDGERTGKDKTSVLFLLNHSPGSLYKALEPFYKNKINMTRIESRPMKVRNWEYLFYADLEGHRMDENLAEALKGMEKHCAILKILGSYPEGGMIWD